MDTVLTCLEIGVARRDVGLVEAGLANILICISSGGMTSNKLILATSDLVGDILTSASISERFSSVSVMIGLGSTVLSKLAGVRAGLAYSQIYPKPQSASTVHAKSVHAVIRQMEQLASAIAAPMGLSGLNMSAAASVVYSCANVILAHSGYFAARPELLQRIATSLIVLLSSDSELLYKGAGGCYAALAELPSHATNRFMPVSNWVSAACASATMIYRMLMPGRGGSSYENRPYFKPSDVADGGALLYAHLAAIYETHGTRSTISAVLLAPSLPGVYIVQAANANSRGEEYFLVLSSKDGFWPVVVRLPGLAIGSSSMATPEAEHAASALRVQAHNASTHAANTIRGLLATVCAIVGFGGFVSHQFNRGGPGSSSRKSRSVALPIAHLLESIAFLLAAGSRVVSTKAMHRSFIGSDDGILLPAECQMHVADQCVLAACSSIVALSMLSKRVVRACWLRHLPIVLRGLSFAQHWVGAHRSCISTYLLAASSSLIASGTSSSLFASILPVLAETSMENVSAWITSSAASSRDLIGIAAKGHTGAQPLGTGDAALGGKRGRYSGKKRVRSAAGQLSSTGTVVPESAEVLPLPNYVENLPLQLVKYSFELLQCCLRHSGLVLLPELRNSIERIAIAAVAVSSHVHVPELVPHVFALASCCAEIGQLGGRQSRAIQRLSVISSTWAAPGVDALVASVTSATASRISTDEAAFGSVHVPSWPQLLHSASLHAAGDSTILAVQAKVSSDMISSATDDARATNYVEERPVDQQQAQILAVSASPTRAHTPNSVPYKTNASLVNLQSLGSTSTDGSSGARTDDYDFPDIVQ